MEPPGPLAAGWRLDWNGVGVRQGTSSELDRLERLRRQGNNTNLIRVSLGKQAALRVVHQGPGASGRSEWSKKASSALCPMLSEQPLDYNLASPITAATEGG